MVLLNPLSGVELKSLWRVELTYPTHHANSTNQIAYLNYIISFYLLLNNLNFIEKILAVVKKVFLHGINF